ncbi:MAG: NADPH-dependent F420 reductase [archaeon]
MQIGILGGTGNMGKGLALRWSRKHKVLLGSRSLDRAKSVAEEYDRIARGFYGEKSQGTIAGDLNQSIIRISDALVISVPPQHSVQVAQQMKSSLRTDHVVISTIAPMERDGRLFRYKPYVSEGQTALISAAESIAREIAPVPVVSAFQTVPASYLADLDSILNIDVLISGDDERALRVTSDLVRDIQNLRPLRVGPLSNSQLVESITPLLLNAAILNNLRDPSIRIVPWLPSNFGQ